MGAMSRPSAGFRWFALLAALGTWALVAVGGLVRVTESGLGCPDWPLCDGRGIPHSEKTALFEWSHRVTAAPGWIVGVHFVIGLLMLGVAVVTAVAAWRGAEVRSTPGFRRLAAWTVLAG